MPFLVSWVVATRPNTNIPFYDFTEEVLTHLEQKYTNTGLLHSLSQPMSADGLSRTTKFVWYVTSPQEAINIQAILAGDPFMETFLDTIDTYHAENGIQKSTLFYEVRDDDGNILDSDTVEKELWLIKDGRVFINR